MFSFHSKYLFDETYRTVVSKVRFSWGWVDHCCLAKDPIFSAYENPSSPLSRFVLNQTQLTSPSTLLYSTELHRLSQDENKSGRKSYARYNRCNNDTDDGKSSQRSFENFANRYRWFSTLENALSQFLFCFSNLLFFGSVQNPTT